MPMLGISPTVQSIRFEKGDLLKVTRHSVENTFAANLTIVMVDDAGSVLTQQEALPAITAGSTTDRTFSVGAGWLVSATISVDGTAALGDYYAVLTRIRSAIDTAPNRLTFLAGYITQANALTYPENGVKPLQTCCPENRRINIPDPAAGANISITSFTKAYGQILGGAFNFSTGVAAGNRNIVLEITTSAVTIVTVACRTTITANQGFQIQIWNGPNLPDDNTGTLYLPVPWQAPIDKPTITIFANGIFGTDQFDTINLIHNFRPSINNF